MVKAIKFILIIGLLGVIGYFAFVFLYPVYQDEFAPETKEVYTWTDENGTVHFSNVPLHEEQSGRKIQEKKFKDFGDDKFVIQRDEESSGESNRSAGSSSQSSPTPSSSKKKRKGNFIDRLRDAKDEAKPEDDRTPTEKVINTVPPVPGSAY